MFLIIKDPGRRSCFKCKRDQDYYYATGKRKCFHFITDAIKHHLLQWFHEKNRKIEDGYDYEVKYYFHSVNKIKNS